MVENDQNILDRILRALNCSNDQELFSELKKFGLIHQPQISRWRNKGFSNSTMILIDRLLLEIDNLKSRKKRKPK